MARMMVGSREYVMGRYKLHKIKEIEDLVADAVQIVSECLLKQSACRETFASWQLHPGPNCGCSELGPFSAANGQKPDRPPSCSAVHSLVRLVSHAGRAPQCDEQCHDRSCIAVRLVLATATVTALWNWKTS